MSFHLSQDLMGYVIHWVVSCKDLGEHRESMAQEGTGKGLLDPTSAASRSASLSKLLGHSDLSSTCKTRLILILKGCYKIEK